jgi:WD40 repeat protein
MTLDGKKIISGSYDKTIRIWNIEALKEEDILEGHSDSVSSVSISPDGKKLISGSYDKTIRIWDI